ncbi:MAG: type I DNA topoisomerase [Lachnospiraceae bacterium]|nr:type I DNA topoisomerase [Lachnospiraceae bacterium]
MANKLIIVESPAKVHTIKKFLGSGYDVVASAGHIRDLPKSRLGVDVKGDFEPEYITIRGKGEVMAELKKAVKKADKIYLATDPDREGEAISWHLQEALKLGSSGKEVYRITFNEITKNAVREAIKNPTKLNENLVSAQQARRVMDRVVGYELSPILWKKVKGKLSAGRVQSAVLRLVCDRENEISEFIPQEYWTIGAELFCEGRNVHVSTEYYGKDDKKAAVSSEEEADAVEKAVEGKLFTLTEKKNVTRRKASPYPFTTSTLQQDASNRLNFSTQKTMRLAQQLYEGVKLPGHGTIGLITYLRTDSTRVAAEADASCKSYVRETYGNEYVGAGAVKNSDLSQDAHEAIRPTDMLLTPESVKNDLPRDLYRLYNLIYRRFVASRMKAAVYDSLNARFNCGEEVFTASSTHLSFPGYLLAYEGDEEKAKKDRGLETLEEGDVLSLDSLKKQQHFTQPPAHFTEATLVREMEELGLGRPSTYAPTITNILSKHYITREGRNLFVTELGEVVNALMLKSFPDIVDLGFTASMEKQLDAVEEGSEDWHEVMREFYPSFSDEIRKAEKELEKVKVEDEKTDVVCELCGRQMVVKYGRNGKFLACPGFPECRNTKPLLEYAGIACPKCGKELVVRRTKKGRRFYACESPDCDFMSWNKPKKGEKGAEKAE